MSLRPWGGAAPRPFRDPSEASPPCGRKSKFLSSEPVTADEADTAKTKQVILSVKAGGLTPPQLLGYHSVSGVLCVIELAGP